MNTKYHTNSPIHKNSYIYQQVNEENYTFVILHDALYACTFQHLLGETEHELNDDAHQYCLVKQSGKKTKAKNKCCRYT